jgi:hypothetical protein
MLIMRLLFLQGAFLFSDQRNNTKRDLMVRNDTMQIQDN